MDPAQPVAEGQTENKKWLGSLMNTKFFGDCEVHGSREKFYCIHCKKAMCQQCQSKFHKNRNGHKFLRALQKEDLTVLQVNEMNLIDCSNIQFLSVNKSDVVRINPKPGPERRPCESCFTSIEGGNHYYSLECKINADLPVTEGQAENQTWLGSLMETEFFTDCEVHESSMKTFYCINCEKAICKQCRSESRNYHQGHRFLQALKEDQILLRVHEKQNPIDCSQIQILKAGSSDAIRINPNFGYHLREGSRYCDNCFTIISEGNLYCSLACKAKCSPNELYLNDVTQSSTYSTTREASSSGVKRENDDKYDCNSPTPTKRKSRRKDTPTRAPFS